VHKIGLPSPESRFDVFENTTIPLFQDGPAGNDYNLKETRTFETPFGL
jgi:hypothetical protein